MILIGIGANIPSQRFATPLETVEAALSALAERPDVRVLRRSRWYESAPVPMSDQPWYINGACIVETTLDAPALLAVLHAIEADFGRVRGEKNAPRVLDLDLLAYDDFVSADSDAFCIPHPRLHERAFVLLPLRDLVPGWSHPTKAEPLDALIAALANDQIARPLEDPHVPEDADFEDDWD